MKTTKTNFGVDSLSVTFRGRLVGNLGLDPVMQTCIFAYDAGWLADGFSISPLELPLTSDTFLAKFTPFDGGFGIFEDSMPDGYGRYLLHKALQHEGIDDRSLTILDRLAIIGKKGMGGLEYHPSKNFIYSDNSDNLDTLQQKALEVLSERQEDDAEMLLFRSGNSGGARPKAIFSDESGHWLVKFRHTYDPMEIGKHEFEMNELARECGITVPDFRLINGKYFASRRFDIDAEGNRLHTATAGGLLGVALGNPVLDYHNLLALTGYLTQDPAEVEEMYRRMVFNYLAGNRDDHCKNFSFLIDRDSSGKWEWSLAPAYDLTGGSGGYNGQHAISVNGTSTPTIDDFIAVGIRNQLRADRCRAIYSHLQAIIQ